MKKLLALLALFSSAIAVHGQQPGEIKPFTFGGTIFVPPVHQDFAFRVKRLSTVSPLCLHGQNCIAFTEVVRERPDLWFTYRPASVHPVLSLFGGRMEIGSPKKLPLFVPQNRMFVPYRKGPRGAISFRFVF